MDEFDVYEVVKVYELKAKPPPKKVLPRGLGVVETEIGGAPDVVWDWTVTILRKEKVLFGYARCHVRHSSPWEWSFDETQDYRALKATDIDEALSETLELFRS